MSTFLKRLYWAARLDWLTYEAIKADSATCPQALAIVAVASLADTSAAFRQEGGESAAAFLAYLAWFWVSWYVNLRFIQGMGKRMITRTEPLPSLSQLVQTTSFAMGPAVFLVLSFEPRIGTAIGYAVGVWLLVAEMQALRVAFGFKSWWDAIVLAFAAGLVASILLSAPLILLALVGLV
jgi:hypothetical protein